MIPQVKNKFGSKRSLEPLTFFLKTNQAQSLGEVAPAPKSIIFCPSTKMLDFIDLPLKNGPKIIAGNEVKIINDKAGVFAAFVGFGAPMWTWILEQLIAWGVKKFIYIGFFGQIDPKLDPDNIFIAEKSLRDEGTSYHYKEASDWAYSSKKLNKELIKEDQKLTPTSVWTIDAMFMQTEADIKYGIENKIAGFEMETSALFTVADFHGCEMSSLQIVSDGYINGKYMNIYKTPEFDQRFKKATEIALKTLNK